LSQGLLVSAQPRNLRLLRHTAINACVLGVTIDVWSRLQVSGISAFVVSLIYVKFRMMLFIMIAGLTSQVD